MRFGEVMIVTVLPSIREIEVCTFRHRMPSSNQQRQMWRERPCSFLAHCLIELCLKIELCERRCKEPVVFGDEMRILWSL